MRLLPVLLGTALCLLGCPKRAETKVASSADEQMEQWTAELEELRARAAAEEGHAQAVCTLAGRACPLSEQVCQLAAQSPDREDFQRQCGRAQEDCARYRDTCARAE